MSLRESLTTLLVGPRMFNPYRDRWWTIWQEDAEVKAVIQESIGEPFSKMILENKGRMHIQGTTTQIAKHRTYFSEYINLSRCINLVTAYNLALLFGGKIEDLIRSEIDYLADITRRIIAETDCTEREIHAYVVYMASLPIEPSDHKDTRSKVDDEVLEKAIDALQAEDQSWEEKEVINSIKIVADNLGKKLGHLVHKDRPGRPKQ